MYISTTVLAFLLFFSSVGFSFILSYLIHVVGNKLPENKLTYILTLILVV